MSLVESWDPGELESLENEAKLRSFALDPAWAEAAAQSHYAHPQSLGLREGSSLRAVCVGLRRSRAGFSKVVCGTNGGVGILWAEPRASDLLIRGVWRRWRPSELQIFGSEIIPDAGFRWEPAYTIHIDLRRSLDDILGNFRKRTRKHLSQALQDGVTATTAMGGDVEEAWDLIASTAREKHFRLPPRAYLVSLHQAFGRSGLSELVVAKHGGRLLGAIHMVGARGVASWWKSGSTREGYSLNASTVALWQAMKIAKERGFQTFDLGGTHPTNPNYAAIHRFKSSFGGSLVQTVVGTRSTVAARAAKWLSSISP